MRKNLTTTTTTTKKKKKKKQKTKNQKQKTKNQKPKTKNQKPKTKNQKPKPRTEKIGAKKKHFWIRTVEQGRSFLTDFPQRQLFVVIIMHFGHSPAWQRAVQRWIPQGNNFPHVPPHEVTSSEHGTVYATTFFKKFEPFYSKNFTNKKKKKKKKKKKEKKKKKKRKKEEKPQEK